MQPVTSTRPSSTCLRRNLHDGATCSTRRRTSASLRARLGNPSQTCFHAKQAARSQRVSRADLPPSILWHNRQTEAHLVLRHKPRNRRGDFEAQITKPGLPVLRPKPLETVATSFEAKPAKTVAAGFEANPLETVVVGFDAKPSETVTTDFEAKPAKTVRVVLRPNHSQTITIGLRPKLMRNRPSGFEAKPLTNHRPWF
jgi:hypothetical protein